MKVTFKFEPLHLNIVSNRKESFNSKFSLRVQRNFNFYTEWVGLIGVIFQ